jgi:hypothetical protein
MSGKQKLVVMAGVCLVALMILFPPWKYTIPSSAYIFYSQPGPYGFLFFPPSPSDDYSGLVIDFSRLLIQIAGVGLVVGGLLAVTKGGK